MSETQISEVSSDNHKLKRPKISIALKGRTIPDERKKRVGQGVKNAWKNRKHNGYNSRPKPSEETKRKMSKAKKEQWRKIKEALKQYDEKEETSE